MNLGSWLQTYHKGKGTYCQQEKSHIIKGGWLEENGMNLMHGIMSHSAPPQFKGSHIPLLMVHHFPSPGLCMCCFPSLDWPPLKMPSRLYLPCQTPICTQELRITTASSSSREAFLIPSPISLALPILGSKPLSHYITVTCGSSVSPFWTVWSLAAKPDFLFIRLFPGPSQCLAHSRQINQHSILPSTG